MLLNRDLLYIVTVSEDGKKFQAWERVDNMFRTKAVNFGEIGPIHSPAKEAWDYVNRYDAGEE